MLQSDKFCAISHIQQSKQAVGPYALKFTAIYCPDQYTAVTIKEEILYGLHKMSSGLSNHTTTLPLLKRTEHSVAWSV